MEKTYLGDGCYVRLDGCGGLELTTSDGVRDTNTIYLEGSVYAALVQFVDAIKAAYTQTGSKAHGE